MCSFIAYSEPGKEETLLAANTYTKRRGPDATNVVTVEGWTLLHNLLSITGSVTTQPFIDAKKRRACFFNGEIYNWKSFGINGVTSDGQTLLPLYEKYGVDFVKKLDGEFALVLFDFELDQILVTTDPFATKPLWVGSKDGKIGIASYESALLSLGISHPEKVPANTFRVLSLDAGTVLREGQVYTFNPSAQTKGGVDDFLSAFSASIQKRAGDVREKVFIGLSSGYDSGAIACELQHQRIPFKAYSIRGQENQEVLNARHVLLPDSAGVFIEAGYREYQREKRELRGVCEDFVGSLNASRYKPRHILEDGGAIGLGIICKRARSEDCKIYLSGQGADEIISDYRMHGHGLTGHSSISGHFPEDLAAEFPWRNFYEGAQKFYIAKEEHVAGAYGIEARYPFLDAPLVQEFLYLTPEVKNAAYKYPLRVLFEKRGYPFAPDVKVGFIRRKSTVVDRVHQVLDMILGRAV